MSDFLTYLEMLEDNLDEFIAVQKKYLFYRLKKDIRKKFQMMTNISITQDRFATLIQRIKNSQTLKVDSKNKLRND